jgi:hypothetical protein
VPRLLKQGEDHYVACHLYDPEHSASAPKVVPQAVFGEVE